MIGVRYSGPLLAQEWPQVQVPDADGRLRLHRRAAAVSIARALIRERAIKEALGRWVSELEPVLVYDHEGKFAGLTHAGQPFGGVPRVHVEIRDGVAI